ncbi:MAG: hypothetical protein HYV96_19895 [Opitutae bacterium]|nr:hypothetical protein [Opitutae bacterium]
MSASSRTIARCLLFAALALALALCGYALLTTQFMAYDDEGYVLLSYRNYATQGHLYREVFSQYGPLPYVWYHALASLAGFRLDSELVRAVTLACWLGCAAAAGRFLWQQTRHRGIAAGAAVLTFLALLPMIDEPGHPGGLLALLSAAGAVAGATALTRGHWRGFAVVTALCGAAMLLCKVNVGLFFLVAASSWLALHTRWSRGSAAVTWSIALGCAISPLLLMQQLWHERWVREFGFVFAGGSLALLLAALRTRRAEAGARAWLDAALAVVAVVSAVVGAVAFRGTTFSELWQGVVADPLRHPLIYAHATHWPAIAPWLTLAGLGCALVLARRRGESTGMIIALAILRLAALAGFLIVALRAEGFSLPLFGLHFGAPLVWLTAVPLRDSSPGENRARLWLAWVFSWQTLHAYPVAGSQVAWGGFLWVPLAIAGGWEAVQVLGVHLSRLATPLRVLGAFALAVASAVGFGRIASTAALRYSFHAPLGIPGAEHLRLNEDQSADLRTLTRNIEAHAGTLFSYPGMFSFNIWTERPTPTLANATHWFSLLDEPRQRAIVARLENDPRAVIVVQRALVGFLLSSGIDLQGPLHDYLTANFAPALRVGTYELWTRRGRSIAPLGTAQFVEADPAAPRLVVVASQAREIASVEIQPLFGWSPPLRRLAPSASAPWTITRLLADGTADSASASVCAPTAISGITRVEIPLSGGTADWPPREILAVALFDRAGRRVETLRVMR